MIVLRCVTDIGHHYLIRMQGLRISLSVVISLNALCSPEASLSTMPQIFCDEWRGGGEGKQVECSAVQWAINLLSHKYAPIRPSIEQIDFFFIKYTTTASLKATALKTSLLYSNSQICWYKQNRGNSDSHTKIWNIFYTFSEICKILIGIWPKKPKLDRLTILSEHIQGEKHILLSE